jgi:uncharacterized membrane protein YGL010W
MSTALFLTGMFGLIIPPGLIVLLMWKTGKLHDPKYAKNLNLQIGLMTIGVALLFIRVAVSAVLYPDSVTLNSFWLR